MQSNERARVSTGSSQVQGVNASSGGLLAATLGAAIVAGGILTFIWLPAEHGIDPTGVGHLLGLSEMGQIKEKLHAEADAAQSAENGITAMNISELTFRLDAMQAQLSAIAETVGADAVTTVNQSAVVSAAVLVPALELDVAATAWLDEGDYTLRPDQGIEVKLIMQEGAIADYEWSANGAVVSHDTHGDADVDGEEISYEKGRSVPNNAGQITAKFTGNHGWYWRNRTNSDVVITLRTRGDYSGILLP